MGANFCTPGNLGNVLHEDFEAELTFDLTTLALAAFMAVFPCVLRCFPGLISSFIFVVVDTGGHRTAARIGGAGSGSVSVSGSGSGTNKSLGETGRALRTRRLRIVRKGCIGIGSGFHGGSARGAGAFRINVCGSAGAAG